MRPGGLAWLLGYGDETIGCIGACAGRDDVGKTGRGGDMFIIEGLRVSGSGLI